MTTFTHPTSSKLVELYLERQTEIENPKNWNPNACRKRDNCSTLDAIQCHGVGFPVL